VPGQAQGWVSVLVQVQVQGPALEPVRELVLGLVQVLEPVPELGPGLRRLPGCLTALLPSEKKTVFYSILSSFIK
jgi:F420-0:gamma-glutamyl ligase-like protein